MTSLSIISLCSGVPAAAAWLILPTVQTGSAMAAKLGFSLTSVACQGGNFPSGTSASDRARPPSASRRRRAKRLRSFTSRALGIGRRSPPLKAQTGDTFHTERTVPFGMETAPFNWRGALPFMALLDRFVDGDSSSNRAKLTGAGAGAQWRGGSLCGSTPSNTSTRPPCSTPPPRCRNGSMAPAPTT